MKKDAQIIAPQIDQAQNALRLAIMGASISDIQAQLVGTPEEKLEIVASIAAYFKTLAEWDPQVEKGKAYATFSLILLNSFKIQDYKTALSAQKEMAKLLDLYKPQKKEDRLGETIDIEGLLS